MIKNNVEVLSYEFTLCFYNILKPIEKDLQNNLKIIFNSINLSMKILKFVPIILFTRFETECKKFVSVELKISLLNFRNFCCFFLELSFDNGMFKEIYFSLSKDYCSIKLIWFYIAFGYGVHSSIKDIKRYKIVEPNSNMFGSSAKVSFKSCLLVINKIVEKYLR